MSKCPTTTRPRRDRVMVTLSRRGSPRKPTWNEENNQRNAMQNNKRWPPTYYVHTYIKAIIHNQTTNTSQRRAGTLPVVLARTVDTRIKSSEHRVPALVPSSFLLLLVRHLLLVAMHLLLLAMHWFRHSNHVAQTKFSPSAFTLYMEKLQRLHIKMQKEQTVINVYEYLSKIKKRSSILTSKKIRF